MPTLSEIYKNKLKKKPTLGASTPGFTTGKDGIPGASSFTTGNEKNQRIEGGSGMGGGKAATGAAVLSGTGAKPLVDAKTVLSEQATEGGWDMPEANPITAPVQRLGDPVGPSQSDMLASQGAAFDPRLDPRSNVSTRAGSKDLGAAGERVFNSSNTQTKVGSPAATETSEQAVSRMNEATAAWKDLGDYKNKQGDYAGQDRPVTIIGGDSTYSSDMDDYNSGRVGSQGYTRIANERMNLRRTIEDATRGLKTSGAKADVIGNILGAYSEAQKTRLSGEADIAQSAYSAQATMANNAMDNSLAQSQLMEQQRKNTLDALGQDREYNRKAAADESNILLEQAKLGQAGELGANRLQLDAVLGGQKQAIEEGKLKLSAENTAQNASKINTEKAKVLKDLYGIDVENMPEDRRAQIIEMLGM